jgi:hypothetical protein
MDKSFGTWNVRSMYRVGSLRAVGEEIKDEMGGACSTNGGEEECIQDIGWESQKERDH